jgi:hypothetical protein
MHNQNERPFTSTRISAATHSAPALRPRPAILSRRELRRIIEEQIG